MHTSIKMEDDTSTRIFYITDGAETPSQFVKKATFERLKRMEARDERATKQNKEKQIAELKPIVIEIIRKAKSTGELS